MARDTRAGRRTRQSKTAVWYERSKVGTLTRATDGAISFTYDPTWLVSDTAFPVASALPLSKAKWQGDPVVAAFDNLLPDAEGELREKIAARVGAQGKDVFSLLSVLGRGCVGALQFLPVDEPPSEQDMQYRIISEDEMVGELDECSAGAQRAVRYGEDLLLDRPGHCQKRQARDDCASRSLKPRPRMVVQALCKVADDVQLRKSFAQKQREGRRTLDEQEVFGRNPSEQQRPREDARSGAEFDNRAGFRPDPCGHDARQRPSGRCNRCDGQRVGQPRPQEARPVACLQRLRRAAHASAEALTAPCRDPVARA